MMGSEVGGGGKRTFAARGKSRGRSSGMVSGASACLLLMTVDGRGRAPDGRMVAMARDETEGGWGAAWWPAMLCRRRSKKVCEQARAARSDKLTKSEERRLALSFPDQRVLALFLGVVSMLESAAARLGEWISRTIWCCKFYHDPTEISE